MYQRNLELEKNEPYFYCASVLFYYPCYKMHDAFKKQKNPNFPLQFFPRIYASITL